MTDSVCQSTSSRNSSAASCRLLSPPTPSVWPEPCHGTRQDAPRLTDIRGEPPEGFGVHRDTADGQERICCRRFPHNSTGEGTGKNYPPNEKNGYLSENLENKLSSLSSCAILVVEDDVDIRNLLQNTLSYYFRTDGAPDGESGLKMALETIMTLSSLT